MAEPDVDLVLDWIGFDINERGWLADNFTSFAEISDLSEKEMSAMAENFAKRTDAEGKFQWGFTKIKRMKHLIHWVQDFERVGEVPTVLGLIEGSFLVALDVAKERAEVREHEAGESETVLRASSPGKLKDEKGWNKWIDALENMLSAIHGIFGIPLVYVIRQQEERQPDGHQTFVEKCIACAPLAGTKFEADARRVHQMVRGFVQGEQSEQWVKSIRKRKNGREDVKALRSHYQGEGNATRRIADASRLRDTLHYKSERMMAFATFLTQVQHMFNLYAEHGEPYGEPAKIRFLFEKVQCPVLLGSVAALKVKQNLDPESVTFTSAANFLAADVSTTPENARRVASAVETGGGTESIYKDGKIHTGYYKAWNKLSREDRDKVIAERIRTGNNKPAKRKNNRRKVSAATSASKKETKKIKGKYEKAKRRIAALSQRGGSDEAAAANAGNAFGGRAEKKKGKKQKIVEENYSCSSDSE